jgi:uncharacterized protein (TIGR02300 family)
VAKADWGLKRICPHCGTRYYDMKKKQPVCPSCGTVFDPEALTKSRRGRAVPEEKPRKPPVEIEDLPIVEGEEAEEAVIEDADELGDDVAVEEVVEVEEINDRDQ